MLPYIGSVMRRLELDSWTDKAANSFFVHPITIGTDSDGTEKLSNGQHRTWLMREAGAPTTIVAIDVEP